MSWDQRALCAAYVERPIIGNHGNSSGGREHEEFNLNTEEGEIKGMHAPYELARANASGPCILQAT